MKVLNAEKELTVNIANLLKVSFQMDKKGKFSRLYPEESESEKIPFLPSFISSEPKWGKVFSSSSTSLGWEARLAVVQKYADKVNSLTGRDRKFTIKELIRHWREKLLLPLSLASDLKPWNTLFSRRN